MDIFAEVLKKHTDARLLLIGDGELREQTEKKVNQMGLSTKISFLGVRRDVNELMQAADVMVFPSLFEGLPVTLVEAQSTGLPCIISQNIPSEAIITDLVEQVSLSDSASIWADKLISVVERPYDRASYTKNIIKAGFDIKNNAEWLQQFYLDAIAK